MSATMTDEERRAEKAEKERDRRENIKVAKEKASEQGFREGGTPAEILAVLQAAGEPLHVKEITKRVLARKKANLNGKTPEATVAAMLSVQSRKEGSPFVKVDRGTFGLK